MVDVYKNMSWASRRMLAVIFILSLLIIIGGAVIYILNGFEHLSYFIFSVVLMLLMNTVKVFMLESTANTVLKLEADRVSFYVQKQALTRLALTIAVLVAVGLIWFFDVIGAVCGLVAWQIAVYSVKYSKNAAL
jgi:hypothetical protein